MTPALVAVPPSLLSRINRHAELTGKTLKSCIAEALKDYVETNIPAREAALYHHEIKKD